MLVYGDGVGALTPSVDRPGVTVREVVTTGNPNYLFLRLRIDADADAGEFDIVFSGTDGAITRPYRLDERNPDPEHTPGLFIGRRHLT